MAQAEIHETLSVDAEKLMNVVKRYEDYPEYVKGCKSVKVERMKPNQVRVTYFVSLIKDVSYTVDQFEEPETGTIRWELVSSDFMKVNRGEWKIKAAGPGRCEVDYSVEIEFKIPVPGLILNRLVKGSLPEMIRDFESRARES